jgi:hypothetical protein
MLSATCVGILSGLCALVLAWLVSMDCHAQHDPLATARSELGHFSSSSSLLPASDSSGNLIAPFALGPRAEVVATKPLRPWLIAAATTTAALAASYVVFQGLSYRASRNADRNLGLDLDTRLRNRELEGAQDRANLLSRVSDICLAGTVAATGATLLIWLTGKRKRAEQQVRTLLGPMVVRAGGGSGGGLVLRNKF